MRAKTRRGGRSRSNGGHEGGRGHRRSLSDDSGLSDVKVPRLGALHIRTITSFTRALIRLPGSKPTDSSTAMAIHTWSSVKSHGARSADRRRRIQTAKSRQVAEHLLKIVVR